MQTIKLEPNYLIFLETPCAGNKFPTFKLFRDIFTTLPEITISKIEFPTSNICKVYTELKEYLGPRFLSFSQKYFLFPKISLLKRCFVTKIFCLWQFSTSHLQFSSYENTSKSHFP